MSNCTIGRLASPKRKFVGPRNQGQGSKANSSGKFALEPRPRIQDTQHHKNTNQFWAAVQRSRQPQVNVIFWMPQAEGTCKCKSKCRLHHLSSIIHHPSFIVQQAACSIHHSRSIIGPLSFIIQHSSFIIHDLVFCLNRFYCSWKHFCDLGHCCLALLFDNMLGPCFLTVFV